MHTNISYIYYGGTAETLGIAKRGESRNFESIWVKEIFKQIHPDDLSEKYVQELRFYHFLKQIPAKKRADYFLMSKLRMRNTSGKYVPVLHRMFYVSTHSSNSMWLALCLYNLSTDPTKNCMVINSANGQAIELEKEDYSSLLSDREKVILKLIDTGKTSQEIARTLFISKNTVSRHRQNILEKLQVKNSIEACRIAKELKLLSCPGFQKGDRSPVRELLMGSFPSYNSILAHLSPKIISRFAGSLYHTMARYQKSNRILPHSSSDSPTSSIVSGFGRQIGISRQPSCRNLQ